MSFSYCMSMDILIVGSNVDKIRVLKKELASAFVMKDLGAPR
jgi:hypothetical protein